MNLPIRVRREATQDLEEAAAWYEAQRAGLGQEFLDEVRRSLRRVAEHPDLYPPMHRGTRRVFTRRFPFGVFYRVEADLIIVVAIMHGSRDPRRWKQRT